jgi:hypothetical protein
MNADLTEICLDEVLADVGTFGDWLAGDCMGKTADASFCNRLGYYLLQGKTVEVAKARPSDLLFVLMTDTDPAVVIKARAELRDRYLCERSCDVMEKVWAEQDAKAAERRFG